MEYCSTLTIAGMHASTQRPSENNCQELSKLSFQSHRSNLRTARYKLVRDTLRFGAWYNSIQRYRSNLMIWQTLACTQVVFKINLLTNAANFSGASVTCAKVIWQASVGVSFMKMVYVLTQPTFCFSKVEKDSHSSAENSDFIMQSWKLPLISEEENSTSTSISVSSYTVATVLYDAETRKAYKYSFTTHRRHR